MLSATDHNQRLPTRKYPKVNGMAGTPNRSVGIFGDKLTYEEARLKRIEDNVKRMEELGLKEQARQFSRSPPEITPRRTMKRKALNPEEVGAETRRSPRVSRNLSVNYNETKAAAASEDGPRRSKGIGRVLRRGFTSGAGKTEATLKAMDVQTEHPSFVKSMLKSHVSGGFWLGLPSNFCNTHFHKDDLVILEDEGGLEWESIYLHHKHGLSGGWRGFSIDHELEDGDAVVFELVKPTRFKVTIMRAAKTAKEITSEKKAASKKTKAYRYVLRENKENEHVNSALHKVLKQEQAQVQNRKGFPSANQAKTVTASRKRRLDLSVSGASERSGDHEQTDIRDDEEPHRPDAGKGCSSGPGRPSQEYTGKRILRSRTQSTTKVVSYHFSTPASLLRGTTVPKTEAQRSCKSKTNKTGDEQKRKEPISKPSSANGRRKAIVLAREVQIVKKVERKIGVQMTSPTVQNPDLPPGVKLKAVGVCSIARNCCTSKKIPGSTRKYSFFSPAKAR